VGDLGRQVGAPRRNRQPTEHPLIDKSESRLAVRERENDSGVGRERRFGIGQPELAAHAQMSQDRVTVGEGQPQIFSAPPRLGEGAAGDLKLEICRSGQVTAYRPRMQHPYAGDLASRDTAGQATAYDLNLWKFGHRSR
jgi:hypothetical protein